MGNLLSSDGPGGGKPFGEEAKEVLKKSQKSSANEADKVELGKYRC